ncbi:putative MATE family efflux protein [Bacillus mesophilus]|uniref:MATE family efflux transporter n=1 Tax=Bacillus mesophilus TaxID=1808955 RepID=A0A6M0QBP9_9BACI|nr:MATE family efflux transporter [Bacillus mesophilus]MBM7660120.1 putative MATE family efflux protein [Bacillus mesophilus]NEY73773.1 MATE family efflux transporter [Bacillus mesophilus]
MEIKNNKKIITKPLTLFALTWPIFIELFLHMLMGSTDTFMLSHVSDDAVAAVGVANQLVFFTILLFGFVATGTAVLVSQYLGAKKILEAKNASAISITLNLIFGILVSVAVVVFREDFLNLFELTEEIKGYASQYLLIVGGTIFTQALLITLASILRANGFTKDAMFVSIIMNVINVVGNALLIYGFFGLPEMGVQGIAIATAVSRAVALLLMFRLIYKLLPISIAFKDYLNFDIKQIKKILNIGVPAAGEQAIYNTSQIAITAIIAIIGAEALTTRVYAFNIMSFILLFGLAMGQGTQILIGHKVGARDFDGAYNQLLKSLKSSIIITILIAVLVAIFREHLISIFTDNQVIIQVGGSLLLLSLILEPGRTFNLVVINSLRATGDARFPVLMAFISMWGISVPLSYFLGITLGLGLAGVWISFIVDEWLRGIIMYFRWKSRVWEKKILVSNDDQNQFDDKKGDLVGVDV